MQESAYLSDCIFLSVPNMLYHHIFYVNTCPSLIFRQFSSQFSSPFIFFNFFPAQQKQGTETAAAVSIPCSSKFYLYLSITRASSG